MLSGEPARRIAGAYGTRTAMPLYSAPTTFPNHKPGRSQSGSMMPMSEAKPHDPLRPAVRVAWVFHFYAVMEQSQ